MRIRSTKPEFWRSERIASVSWDARLVLKALESYVDDNGVGKDDIALIVSDTFPRDLAREPSRTLARVSEAISELTEAGLLWRYEGNGNRLLFISFWESAQRVDKPQGGRNPRPDGTFNYKDSTIRESSGSPREASRSLAPGTGEQGNRGTGEGGGADAPSPFCARHRPNGTDKPCKACANRRLRIESERDAKKSRPTPTPIRPKTCTIHAEYPLPCDRCAAEAKEAS